MTKEQLEGLNPGDRLVWTELRGTVEFVNREGSANVKLDGALLLNTFDPHVLALAQIEEKPLPEGRERILCPLNRRQDTIRISDGTQSRR